MLPLTHGQAMGLPLTHGQALCLPLTHGQAMGLPLTHGQAIGLPLTHGRALGLPLTHGQALGLPLTHGRRVVPSGHQAQWLVNCWQLRLLDSSIGNAGAGPEWFRSHSERTGPVSVYVCVCVCVTVSVHVCLCVCSQTAKSRTETVTSSTTTALQVSDINSSLTRSLAPVSLTVSFQVRCINRQCVAALASDSSLLLHME